jgi:hypothetical protein
MYFARRLVVHHRIAVTQRISAEMLYTRQWSSSSPEHEVEITLKIVNGTDGAVLDVCLDLFEIHRPFHNIIVTWRIGLLADRIQQLIRSRIQEPYSQP